MTLTRTFTKLDYYTAGRKMWSINIVKHSCTTDTSLQCMHMHFKHSVRYTPAENYNFVLVFSSPEDQVEGDSFKAYILGHPIYSIPALVTRMRKVFVVGDGYRKVLARYNKLLEVGE